MKNANNHRTEYIRFLNEKFAELKIGKYQKNMKNIFDVLLEYGNPKLAVRYAKRILKDGSGKTPDETAPATKVHELVVELAKYLPEEINANTFVIIIALCALYRGKREFSLYKAHIGVIRM